MAERVLVEGAEIVLGGEKFIMPPIPLVKMAKIGAVMQGGDFTRDADYTQAIVDAIWWSLQRNYGAAFPRETVENNIDPINFEDILNKFMAVNGFTKAEQQSGEAPASQ